MRSWLRRRSCSHDQALSVLFATDLHGSEAAFRKYVNAALKFNVDVCILGGDLTGKALVPLVEANDGITARFMGKTLKAGTDAETQEIERIVRLAGQYPVRVSTVELARMREDPEVADRAFLAAMEGSLKRWFDLAGDRLGEAGIPMFAICGNDDPHELDVVLADHDYVQHVDGAVGEVTDDLQILGFSGANRTPWRSPREFAEEAIAERLSDQVGRLADVRRSIWDVHVPPRDSGLDTCAEVRDDLTIVTDGGEPRLIGAGSSAVRELIDLHQPLLTLHGHIHESRGVRQLGSTISVNPGSEYTEGILRAALIRLTESGVRAQLMST